MNKTHTHAKWGHPYTSVGVTESSIMPFYDHDDNRNWYVVEVAARRSSWRHIRVFDEIAMHSYLPYTVFNTLRPRQDGCLFADDILKCIFLNLNSWIPNKISWKYVA